MTDLSTGPPDAALAAFGATHPAESLAGGMGDAWRSGDIVFKRFGAPIAWLAWEERVLAAVRGVGARIQQIRRAHDGALSVDGWVARDYLAGDHRSRRWQEIIDAGDALHAAFAKLPDGVALPPAAPRTDAWAIADRIAWDELPMSAMVSMGDAALGELLDARRPIHARCQLVHGDLTGNVVFADPELPGIIDFSPYWRPTSYAVGVVVADAIVWEGADLTLLDRAANRPDMGQCLVRALIFRHITALLLPGRLPSGDAADRYSSVRRAAVAMASG